MEDNPFPSVMGRVCYHPCEAACNRAGLDEPLAIHAVERFLGDFGLVRGLPVDSTEARCDERIAVIGAGPAGLSAAYQLARRGYRVTVFEALSEAGGVLRWGIPPYRLPREILRQEIVRIQSLGVEIRLGVSVGRDISWESLGAHQTALVAAGLSRGRRLLNLGNGVEGVYDGLEFLRMLAADMAPRIGRRVAVIGGGNVAIDVARSAIRLGAEEVALVCLEPFEDMPAHPEEIEEAQAEGVSFCCGFSLRNPVVANGRIAGLEVSPVRFLGREPDGEVRYEPAQGPHRALPADTIIQAIGQEANLGFLPPDLIHQGRLAVDGWGQLLQGTVFAAGDVVSGPARVVDAIAAGKRAALGIHRLLRGGSTQGSDDPIQAVQIGDLNLFYFPPTRRTGIPRLAPAARKHCMAEVNGGWGEAEAVAEARRCFNCGVCTACDNCVVFCPDLAVRRGAGAYSYEVLDQYCKGCGICARECPRHVITMVPATP
jgi:NADPH-dependent glutamate synthase beta subunit-like oxidoreductase